MTASAAKRPRAARGSLSAEQILEAACDLIASVGLDNFSMPELARRLEVGVTSVYWYFRSRDDLIRAIAERVTSEFYEGLHDDVGLSGDDLVLRQFRLYWQRLKENPLWREVFISSFSAAVLGSPESGRRSGAVLQRQIERMVDAGLEVKEAAVAYRILSAYTRGSVFVMHMDRAGVLSADDSQRGAVMTALSGEAREGWAGMPDDDVLFDAGLRALWSGLLAQSRPARSG
jgi:AcrR family transcriptional regulator